MQSRPPGATDHEHRVLKFKPRPSDALRRDLDETASSDEQDDFRHRMWTNVAAVAFTAALVAFGIWLAVSIADMRKSQDCVLMGRRDCAHLSTRVDTLASMEPLGHRH